MEMKITENKPLARPRNKNEVTEYVDNPVKKYASCIFKESSIGMVVSIVATSSRPRKIFKTLLLMLCISGFLYQCATHLIHVLQYPTIVNVVVERPDNYKIPAYTFCDNNGIKRSVFCNLYPSRCYKPSEEFCLETKSYCGNADTKIPMEEFYNTEDTMSTGEILEYGENLKEFFVPEKSKLQNNDHITGPYLRFKKGVSGAMLCYSLHSVVINNNYPFRKKRVPSIFVNGPDDKLTFFVQENETFIPGNRPGIYFAIHSPYDAVNPFAKGIFMKTGRTYRIYITMERELLLKDPFVTKCMNYEEIWESNNHTGARIQEMCQQKCFLEESLSCHNCVHPEVLHPYGKMRICNKNEINLECDDVIEDAFERCWNSCRDDCRVTRYVPDVMEVYEVEYAKGKDMRELNQYITVELYLEDNEIFALKYSPKYMDVEVFSAIGGFLGIWLGISFMDVTDILGSVFALCKYAYKKHVKRFATTKSNDL